ncbi:RagB/SusD family nutrient uptake outer membrane protein [Pedobacter antarcticus]|uniref:RagB/SusD family nutrient uptake outer membrane protein n=1 Tax=Pedobacter antarcticus TaxID=34086 RepID=UPI0029311E7C|nr:RagB/SusD family nutrient uptake outer membrane protein [Pedobacter antarcticus]
MKIRNDKKSKTNNVIKLMFYMAFLFSLSICSCKKLLDVPKSSSLILNKDVFADNATATSAVMGLYNKMVALNLSMSNGGLSIYPALSADELYNPLAHTGYDPFSSNDIPVANTTVSNNFWSTGYKNIYHANAILEGLNASNTVSKAARNQLRGETLVIRALYLFYLTNFFGDIPLVLSTDFERNATMRRTPADEVIKQLITDLKEASVLLIPTYEGVVRARVNSYTARAFLARVYLYNREWEKAAAESSAVISSGLYSLERGVDKAFLSTSNETIWQLVRENLNTAEAVALIPVSTVAMPALVIRNELLNSFEIGDERKNHWMKFNMINGQRYYYPYKYKIRTGSTVSEYLVVFRLAEQYLIRAEARAEQGNLSGAIEDLNILRTRSRALTTTELPNPLPSLFFNLDKSTLLDAVYKERFTELFCEWGHRWLDLKRSGKANSVISKFKPSWKSYAELYPIPFAETQLNIYLTQNPGYGN